MTESYRNFPLRVQYDFGAPFGIWRARLDHKAWGKSGNLILYFTRLETGGKYWLSVFWDDGYAPRNQTINFKNRGEVGEVFELTIKPTKTGKLAFIAARQISPDDPPAADAIEAPNSPAEQREADSAPILAPKVEKPAPRKPRQAWGGKYADLSKPDSKEGRA